ncbi:fibrobacter succinogenes major paralogous domain-containing protein [bacterium]|nr:fibrobacter succinogenes major paralogous domain-containing protein [bacterium]
MQYKVLIFFLFIFVLFSCNKNPVDSNEEETVTDIDGNTYKIVKIGDQWWMSENLKVTHYQNGDTIPNVIENSKWCDITYGAYCTYNNVDSNLNIYGILYNWYAVNDSRGLAPTGWHVPNDLEWKELEIYLGMNLGVVDSIYFRGEDEGGKMKEAGYQHWYSPNVGASNESGFSALPGGFRNAIGQRFSEGNFYYLGYAGYWWTSTEDSIYAWDRMLNRNNSDIFRSYNGKQTGFSVRCVKDK